ncbi:histidine kinase [Corynebacterium ciconiae]
MRAEVEKARQDERDRIARDMHDSLSHSGLCRWAIVS